MRARNRIRLVLSTLWRSRGADRDLDDEMSAHLEYLTAEHLARGLSARAARDRALRDFGSVAQWQDECRDARALGWVRHLAQDFGYGVRLLRRAPAFATTAMLTIAVGIGATTAVFSVAYGVALRPLPFAAPDRLVALWTRAPTPGLSRTSVAAALLARSFAAVSGIDPDFRTDRVLTLHLAIPRSKYRSDHVVAAVCEQVVQRVALLPEVEAAGMINRLPLAGGVQIGAVVFEGEAPGVIHKTDWRSAAADYFRAMTIPLVRGRTFTEADTDGARPVAVIDQQLAQAVFGDRDPVATASAPVTTPHRG